MSTKATVVYGKNFHLYKEVLDEDFIYLEIEGVKFEASYNRVMIPIPVHIWEVIRQHEGTDLSWADTTEEEIARYVEQQVDERIQKYQQAENDKNKRLIALLGSLPYGGADTPSSLYTEVLVPFEVCQEITAGGRQERSLWQNLKQLVGYKRKILISIFHPFCLIRSYLGEAAVIQLAKP